ncbi:hypothetical protein H4R18_000840 [Coemansia javaensis]|uniref:PIN domain-like protein n=1 Tax=Coemansia javaensis TaxID=2761396 RepID=A0A9W8LK17_9FUNG|nr:hypothetical protein H4R18_000840 [Coemansia javaensis]
MRDRMGVAGLMPLLRRFAPGSIRAPTEESLRGAVLAVDGNIFIHQFLKGDSDGGADATRHVRGMYRLARRAQALGATPLFVFDGAEPAEAKGAELERRRADRARTLLELDHERARARRIAVLARVEARLRADMDVDADDVERVQQQQQQARAAAEQPPPPPSGRSTHSGRMDALEASVGRQLLAELGASDGHHADGDCTRQSLHELQASNAARITALARRTEPLTAEMVAECARLVGAMGLPVHVAAAGEESEGVCAELCRAGAADAVCSEDLDVVAFGARLVRGFGPLAACASMAVVDPQRARADLGLSRAAFVDLCILCGTDFSATLEKVGPVTALRLVRAHGSIERILRLAKYRPRPGFAPDAARAVFLGARHAPPVAARRDVPRLARPPDPAAVAALLGSSPPAAAARDPFAANQVLL